MTWFLPVHRINSSSVIGLLLSILVPLITMQTETRHIGAVFDCQSLADLLDQVTPCCMHCDLELQSHFALTLTT